MPVISALGKEMQGQFKVTNSEFKTGLGYRRSCIRKTQNKNHDQIPLMKAVGDYIQLKSVKRT